MVLLYILIPFLGYKFPKYPPIWHMKIQNPRFHNNIAYITFDKTVLFLLYNIIRSIIPYTPAPFLSGKANTRLHLLLKITTASLDKKVNRIFEKRAQSKLLIQGCAGGEEGRIYKGTLRYPIRMCYGSIAMQCGNTWDIPKSCRICLSLSSYSSFSYFDFAPAPEFKI